MINTIFRLIDSEGNKIYTRIYVTPAIQTTYSSSLVTSDTVDVLESGASASISLVPNTYDVSLFGSNDTTEFTISLPQIADGMTVNATDYIVTAIPSTNYNAASASYAQYALSASHAQFALSASYAPTSGTIDTSSFVKHDIAGNVSIVGNLTVNGIVSNNSGSLFLQSANGVVAIGASEQLYVDANNHQILIADANLGINTDAPQFVLDVNGSIGNSAGDVVIDGANFGVRIKNLGTEVLSITNGNGYAVGIGQPLPAYPLDVNGTIGNSSGDLTLQTNTDFLHFVSADGQLDLGIFGSGAQIDNGNGIFLNRNSGGNVGIGSLFSADFPLDVNGNINCRGNYLQNGLPYTASHASTASFVKNAVSSSFAVTASNANTASCVSSVAWKTLTYGSTLAWTASLNTYEDRNIVGLSGSVTMSIANLYNGWSGVLQVKTPSGSAYSLQLPSGTRVANNGSGSVFLTSGSLVPSIDMVALAYDGTTLFANIANQWT